MTFVRIFLRLLANQIYAVRLISLVLSIPIIAGAFGVSAQIEKRCYGRIYSLEHMRNNPDQTITAISALLDLDPQSAEPFPHIDITVSASASADFRYAGSTFSQSSNCPTASAYDLDVENLVEPLVGRQCVVDCDGGMILIKKLSETELVLETGYLSLSETNLVNVETDCHLEFSLGDEQAGLTGYRLYRMSDEACDD